MPETLTHVEIPIPATDQGSRKQGKKRQVIDSRSIDAGLFDPVLLKLEVYQQEQQLGTLCVGVTSSDRKVGVSTVATNLAIQAAESGLGDVLLVDANGERPAAHKTFGLKNGCGLTDHLFAGTGLDDCLQTTADGSLDVLPWGSTQLQSLSISPFLLKSLFNDLRSRYQYIFVDLPIIDQASHAISFAAQVDGVVVVTAANLSMTRSNQRMIEMFRENSIDVIGAVMNRYSSALPKILQRYF